VEEVVAMGALRPVDAPSAEEKTLNPASSSSSSQIIGVKEGATFALPVSICEASNSGVYSLLRNSDSDSAGKHVAPATSMCQSTERQVVLCRLIGILRASIALGRDVSTARFALEEEEKAAMSSGPRTIAQVRRENRALAAQIGGGHGVGTDGADYDDNGGEFDESMDEFDRGSMAAAGSGSVGASGASPTRHRAMSLDLDCAQAFECYVDSAGAIARSEARRQTVALAVAWSANWRGSVHWGVHWMLNTPLLLQTPGVNDASRSNAAVESAAAATGAAPAPVRAPAPTTTSTTEVSVADHLLVGISHPARVELTPASGSGSGSGSGNRRVRPRAAVTMSVTLRSVSKNRMYVNVCTSSDNTCNNGSTGAGATSSKQDHGVRRASSLRWLGQTKFSQVTLEAGGVLELPFKVVCGEEGVFDLGLRCFNITVSDSRSKLTADSGGSGGSFSGGRALSVQQSLLTVE